MFGSADNQARPAGTPMLPHGLPAGTPTLPHRLAGGDAHARCWAVSDCAQGGVEVLDDVFPIFEPATESYAAGQDAVPGHFNLRK